jgi:hypothetical protein
LRAAATLAFSAALGCLFAARLISFLGASTIGAGFGLILGFAGAGTFGGACMTMRLAFTTCGFMTSAIFGAGDHPCSNIAAAAMCTNSASNSGKL